MTSPLIEEERGHALWLTLSRPESGNAINRPLLEAIKEATSRADKDHEIKLIVLRGAGKHFCTGLDLKEQWPVGVLEGVRHGIGPREALSECKKPVLALVHGAAIGGGLEMALSADLVIAAPDAKLASPEFPMLGGLPGAGATQRITALAGRMRAALLCFTGQRLSGEEAAAMGLVSETCPAGELEKRGEEISEHFANASIEATMMLKQLLRTGEGVDGGPGLQLERLMAYASSEGLTWPDQPKKA
jgi:enoyl-CoA hydratase/carnithine racemase